MKKMSFGLLSLVVLALAPASVSAQDAGTTAVNLVVNPAQINDGFCRQLQTGIENGSIVVSTPQYNDLRQRCFDQRQTQAADAATCHADLATCLAQRAAAPTTAPAHVSTSSSSPSPAHHEPEIVCLQNTTPIRHGAHGRVEECRVNDPDHQFLVRVAGHHDDRLYYGGAIWNLDDIRRMFVSINTFNELVDDVRELQRWRHDVVDPSLEALCPPVPDHPEYTLPQRCAYWREHLPQPGPSSNRSTYVTQVTNGRGNSVYVGLGGMAHPRSESGAPFSLGAGLLLQLNLPIADYADFFIAEFAGIGSYGNELSGFPTFFAQEQAGAEWYLEQRHRLSLQTGIFVNNWFQIGTHRAPEAGDDYRGAAGGLLLGIRYRPSGHFFVGASVGGGVGDSYSTQGQGLIRHVSAEFPIAFYAGGYF